MTPESRAPCAPQVFRTRSAASIHAPICAMNVCNGVLWTTYGLVTSQPFLFVPNAIGAALALFQVSLCCIFRGKGLGCASYYISEIRI